MNSLQAFIQPAPVLFRDGDAVEILDQTALPYRKRYVRLSNVGEVARAIRSMQVRGAPLIGATAAYGVALALREEASDQILDAALHTLAQTRPTAVNLRWALTRMEQRLRPLFEAERGETAWAEAQAICEEDEATCRAIGQHGLELLREIEAKNDRVRVMTHCNAGWLATLGMGTALAPVYAAYAEGLEVRVVVSETRPRNQGLLTAWELREAGVPHALIADNAAGWMLSRGEVDMVIVGADRVAANGDTANKIGTCLKALAAKAAGIPFYVAAPGSTLDFSCPDGSSIPIEMREAEEVLLVEGVGEFGQVSRLRLAPEGVEAINPAFDVTPAELITGFITERGVVEAAALKTVYGEAA